MKILLFGKNGWIGNLFYEFLNSILSKQQIVCSNIRITYANYEKIVNQIKDNDITHIFVVVGTTRNNICSVENKQVSNSTIDYVEDKLNINLENNLFAQLMMCNIADKLNIHTTIIGTGCVYDDTEHLEKHKCSSYKFTELDLPNYTGSKYSTVKVTVDNFIQMTNSKNVLHLRIRMPISNGIDEYDYIFKIVKYKTVIDVPNSITVLDDFFPIMFDMMCSYKYGTFNMVNHGIISPIEILKLYKEIVDNTLEYKVITTDELHKITIGKRCNVELSTAKLDKLYGYKISDIKTSITRILEKCKYLKN